MRTQYSFLQKSLHWATVLLLLAQWWTGRAVLRTHNAHAVGQQIEPSDLILHKLHTFGGVLILLVVACRLMLRFREGAPPPTSAISTIASVYAIPTNATES